MASSFSARQLFSLESANRTLPLVQAIVTDIVSLFRDVKEREGRLNLIRRRNGGPPRPNDPYNEEMEQAIHELEQDVERLQGFVDELSKLGVEFKDPVMGLVDFPAIRDGEEVYLCWKLGEPTITHWHSLTAGFQGRQLLTESSSA